jgi:hypothetical protein
MRFKLGYAMQIRRLWSARVPAHTLHMVSSDCVLHPVEQISNPSSGLLVAIDVQIYAITLVCSHSFADCGEVFPPPPPLQRL